MKQQTGRQTTNESFSQTSKPINPGYFNTGMEQLTGQIMGLGQIDPSTLVPGVNPLQAQAAAQAGNLTGSPWNFDAALDLTRGIANKSTPQVQSASLLDGLDNYVNPMMTGVVDATLADFDADAGRTRAQQELDLAGAGAFGGSGSALTRSLTEGELARARAKTGADLRYGAYDRAYGFSNADADRRQSASAMNAQNELARRAQTLQSAGMMADLSTALDDLRRTNATTAFDMGSLLRDVEAEQAQAGVNLLGTQVGLFGGLPHGLSRGEETSGSSTSTSKSRGSGFGLGWSYKNGLMLGG